MTGGNCATECVDTVVIGGGQAGLSVGYHLTRRGHRNFVILEGRPRVGDSWRQRWDSLRLFTPAGFSGLDGMPFPAPPHSFPTKDEMGDYLEAYAHRFDLPVRTGVRVRALDRAQGPYPEGRYVVDAGGGRYLADNVVVAMSDYQKPKVPAFASELDPDIVQIHSADYRNPGDLKEGAVLIVGAGNSGAEIATELAPRHTVFVSGRDTGHLPFRIGGFLGRLILVRLVVRGLFHRVLTVDNAVGRAIRRKILHKGGPLIRTWGRDMERVGARRVVPTRGVEGGMPVLEDGRVLDVANVVWCTGFHPGFDWIRLPVFERGDPVQRSGIVEGRPGLFFVGLFFLHALSSAMIHGVGRDAERVARAIVQRGASTEGADRLAATAVAGGGA